MVNVKIDRKMNGGMVVPEFLCPHCGSHECFFMQMPDVCWDCGKPYFFDISQLLLHKVERKFYHFNEATAQRLPAKMNYVMRNK